MSHRLQIEQWTCSRLCVCTRVCVFVNGRHLKTAIIDWGAFSCNRERTRISVCFDGLINETHSTLQTLHTFLAHAGERVSYSHSLLVQFRVSSLLSQIES